MKKISFILLFLSAGLFLSCEESDSVTVVPHVSFENDRVFGINPDEGTSTQEIKVYTTTKSGSDRVYNLVVDAELTTLDASEYTLPATVTIPANSREGSFSLTVTSSDLGSDGKVLAIAFGDVEEGTFKGAAPLILTAKEVCPFNELAFELVLDRYGTETVWELIQGSDVIATGGPYTDITTNTTQPAKNFSFCLPAGDYILVVYDLYGDGMCCTSGNGSFELTEVSTGAVLASGGQFTEYSLHEFTLD